ncbi:winged helix-turn-helix domain-containing protein [Nesterenkonia flava]|uniref:Winged helix-turn-helix domain-containing protein n=1 Tax=Nesterenkonia flava TaxID=469799 RepID=A0ABU1FUH8_9MICC|nr:winged helix-turn-helix domain-containing protein [Nesterenkonia flava]MDR5711907.1 winged helix-turn-helix domain-containing protein [Nesterenkonia flava]
MAQPARDVQADDHYLRVQLPEGDVEIVGNVLLLPGTDEPIRLAPGPLAVMRVLVKAQGAVISREHLLQVLPHCGSEHALEMWVSRLRKSLPSTRMVQTVVKRGYRLALPPASRTRLRADDAA